MAASSAYICDLRDSDGVRWFAQRDAAVVQASAFGVAAYVARDLVEAVAGFEELDIGAAPREALTRVVETTLDFDDVVVFAHGTCVGVFRAPLNGLNYAQLLDEQLLGIKDPGRAGRERAAWLNSILSCAVEALSARGSSVASNDDEDPFSILGIQPTSDRVVIRAAYRAKMREYHPDHHASSGAKIRALAERETARIAGAYAEIKASWSAATSQHR